MDKLEIKNKEDEYLKITQMILKGMTIQKIADSLNYSESTVCNRLNILFQKYSAKNRIEFTYNFLNEIIKRHKNQIKILNKEILYLKKTINDIKDTTLCVLKKSEKFN